MISVNIDKLINMSLDDKKTYGELAKNVLDELNGEKTFAVVTGGMGSFKLAYSLYEMKKKVLFIDADISSEIFVGKYKLGKNIPGVVDFISDVQKTPDIICHTNKEGFDIIFSGSNEIGKINKENEIIIKGLIESFGKGYDVVIVDSDISGTAAKYVYASVVMVDEDKYDEEELESLVKDLELVGCNIKGVIINEQNWWIYRNG